MRPLDIADAPGVLGQPHRPRERGTIALAPAEAVPHMEDAMNLGFGGGADPGRHPAAALPATEVPQQVDEAAMTPVLDCLAGLHQVTLNGDLLRDPQLQFYTHPQTGLRGVILYIPTEGLPRGRNLLTVQQAPRAEESDGAGSSAAGPLDSYIIPFWL